MHGAVVADEPMADVLVGVDGSGPSTQALIWALRLAADRGWTLEVVTAWPGADVVHVRDVPGHFSEPRHHAFVALDAALARARDVVAADCDVRCLVVNAHPVEALRERAASARMVVTGSHGDRRLSAHPRRASVGESLALQVSCPVVMVWDADQASGPAADPAVPA